MASPWYMTPAMKELLRLIRLHEGGKAGYNADFRNDDHFPVTSMTLDQTIAAAKRQVSQGEPSSAIGGYQFLSKTLEGLKRNLRLSGNEIMTPAFQDDLAVALMNGRGHLAFLRGQMSATDFANNLAKEWASLPVVSKMRGARRTVYPGQSYYAGDGLNKSFHTPAVVLAAVDALRKQAPSQIPPPPVQPPDDPGPTPETDPETPPAPPASDKTSYGVIAAAAALVLAGLGKLFGIY